MIESNVHPTLPTEKESEAQAALAAWFAGQHIQSLNNLEQAARQIMTLCTTLLGLLLGLMALAEDSLPRHMQWSGVQWLSGIGVVCLFGALVCALSVVMPARNLVILNDPDNQQAVFKALLERKHRGLWAAVIAFGMGMLCLVAVVVVSLAFVV